jgi:hypothetical protein
MLMVYSRVTTSAMAERVFLPWVVLTALDISATGREENVSNLQFRRKRAARHKNVELILTEWADRETSAVVGDVVDCRRNWDFRMSFFWWSKFSVARLSSGNALIG